MFKQFGFKDFIAGLLITIAVISLNYVSISGVQQLLQRVEGILYDTRLLSTLPTQTRQFDEQIIIIDIDEKSMREQGRYPWSRSKVSDLVNKLIDAGVVVVAFDVFFAEPERNPVQQIITKNSHLSATIKQQLNALYASVDADKEFAATLNNTDVVLGFLFDNNAQSTGVLPKHVITWQQGANLHSEIPQYQAILGNIPSLQAAAQGAGFINSTPDSDGFIRKASLILNYKNKLYPSLALEAARVYTLANEINTISKKMDDTSWLQGISFGKNVIPTNEKGQILIPYKGPQKSFPYISATDVLNNRTDAKLLEGSIAFVGTSAVGLADLRTTSVGVQYPGVEVHANVFEGLMHPEIIPTTPDTALALIFLLLISTGIILSFIMSQQGPARILLVCVFSFVFHLSLNWYLWSSLKISLPLFQLFLLIMLLTTYYGVLGFITESNKRKQIKGIFDQYVPPAYIDQLIQSKKTLELKSERRDMTVLFADIRNFTTLSEQFTPEQLSDFLNEYLSDATHTIFDHQGTIDKYVGDMIMAFWNAPLDDEKHAYNAVISALELITLTKTLSTKFTAKGWPEISVGIGVSTGDMVVGDMGSSYRKAYTVLGDAVNLGSRIESLTKYYQVDILINENNYQQVAPLGLVCRQIDKIKVKGKHDAVIVYQPLCQQGDVTPAMQTDLTKHQQAIDYYLAGDWLKAKVLFEQLLQSTHFSTHLYNIYLERLVLLENTANMQAWDGIYNHEHK